MCEYRANDRRAMQSGRRRPITPDLEREVTCHRKLSYPQRRVDNGRQAGSVFVAHVPDCVAGEVNGNGHAQEHGTKHYVPAVRV